MPSNVEAEESVLGAMLLSAEATANVAPYLTGEAFLRPSHGHIFAAVIDVTEAGYRVDAVTVAAELAKRGLLEDIGGSVRLIDLQAGTPSISNALHYAVLVLEAWESRRAIQAVEQAATALYEGVRPAEAVSGVMDAVGASSGSTWAPVDVSHLWAADFTVDSFAPPVLGVRVDGAKIAAPGATGLLLAAPESGKSLLSLAWCVEAASAGRNAIYVDFESRSEKVIGRLRQHRRSAACQDRFTYIRPRNAMSSADRWAARRMMATLDPQIVVIDGYNALLAKHKLDANNSSDIAALAEMVVEPFTSPATCTILIDHISKDDARQSRANTMAIGSIAKTGLVDWALAVQPNADNRIRKGAIGESLLQIAKDRDGELRHLANRDSEFGWFKVNSDKHGNWNHHVALPAGLEHLANQQRMSEGEQF